MPKPIRFYVQWWWWVDLAVPTDLISPMKRSVSVRPFFTILLLILFTVTLSCRILIRKGGVFTSIQLQPNLIVHPPLPVFNSTLLKYASIDIGEAKSNQEIEQLLEGSFASQGRYKSFTTWRRSNHRSIRSSSSKGMPLIFRSPQFYRYWLDFRRVLQNWSRNKRFQPDIMSQLVELMGAKKKYESCAVVGNSGILLQKNFGELIDGHEMVFRLNNARIERFEQFVGFKTNVSFVNSNILHLCARRVGCFCHPYGANVPMVMYICQPMHLLDYTICNASRNSPVIITDRRFDLLCSRVVKYYSLKRFAGETGKSLDEWSSSHDGSMFHYSSGFQAVMLALGTCEKVSIFGFGKSAQAKHHYHTNQKGELRLHDYAAEYDFYHDFVSNPLAIPFVSANASFGLFH
ncbi:beta-1,6-galactosyltransferase GALT29A isoform X2 [Mercurialis annua]|uniref:beta-1,6-galactosyltransferase GALT29A isoform X2 n=1 Tax=Mercurialis annua TaxID=3986 RepID=UPI00215E1C76|nr:beta-1,6-galactosyltransferase GALT29A isoform X2 [Mercurialis annua]